MGISAGSAMGLSAVGYYLLAYLVSNLTVFLVVVTASKHLGTDAIDAYGGLSKRSPFLAASMFLGFLSLAGVPPLAGFPAKFFVLLATAQQDKLWLVAIGAINVAISLYYYLSVVKRLYLNAPKDPTPIALHPATRFTLGLLLLGILLVGIFQEPLLAHLERITRAFSPNL